MTMNSIYENGGEDDAVSVAYRLHGLCKVGAAASDSTLSIDLHRGGWTDMFEAMAHLCDGLIDRLEQERSARAKADLEAAKGRAA